MQATVWQKLVRWTPVRILADALNCYDKHHCLYMAAAISFYAMISMGPLIYLALIALQRFIGSSEKAQVELLSTLQGFMLPDAAAQLVTRVSGASLLGSFENLGTWWAILALIWAGMSFYDVLSAIFSVAWGGTKLRMFFKRKVRAFFAFVGAGVFFILAIALSGALALIQAWGNKYLDLNLDNFWLGVGWLLPYLLAIAVFFLLYKFLPNVQVDWQLALWIAIPVGILWELSKRLFVYWGGGFTGNFYGPLAWFILLMIWIYWSSTIVLLGAEVGAAVQRHHERFFGETG